MRKTIILLLSTLAITLGFNSTVSAQIVDQVAFVGVEPSVLGSPEPQTRSFTVTNTGEVSVILFSGTITALDSATFASDHLFDIVGPNLNVQGIQFSSVTGFDGEIDFIGFVEVVGQIATGDNLLFNFVDGFENGIGADANARIDVTFEFIDRVFAQLTKTNLGSFVLNQGFYDRGFSGGNADHPYRVVEFEVSEDGLYSIESIWDDGIGEINSFDGFLFLFDQPFDGVDDTNSIAFNDDNGDDINVSKISSVFLQQGIKYTALLTSFTEEAGNSGLMGQLNIISLEGNSAFLVDDQNELEPSSLLPVLLFILEGEE